MFVNKGEEPRASAASISLTLQLPCFPSCSPAAAAAASGSGCELINDFVSIGAAAAEGSSRERERTQLNAMGFCTRSVGAEFDGGGNGRTKTMEESSARFMLGRYLFLVCVCVCVRCDASQRHERPKCVIVMKCELSLLFARQNLTHELPATCCEIELWLPVCAAAASAALSLCAGEKNWATGARIDLPLGGHIRLISTPPIFLLIQIRFQRAPPRSAFRTFSHLSSPRSSMCAARAHLFAAGGAVCHLAVLRSLIRQVQANF